MYRLHITLTVLVIFLFLHKTFSTDVSYPSTSNRPQGVRFDKKTVFRSLGVTYSLFVRHAAVSTFRRRSAGATRDRLVLLYLAGILLAQSYAPEPNPGPTATCAGPLNQTPADGHPPAGPSSPRNCGTCDLSVSWVHRGITCDQCGQWFHADCQSIGSSYSSLGHSDVRWNCLICDNNNLSDTAYDPYGAETSDRPQVNLSEASSLNNSFNPTHCSSPTRTSRQNRQKYHPLRFLSLNFRSASSKKAEIIDMLRRVRPDVILGTETWLDPNIGDGEFMPDNFRVYRRDRRRDGGGVMIAVSSDLVCTRAPELETDCEMVWVRLKIQGRKDLLVCTYYRPHEGDEPSLLQFHDSLRQTILKHPNTPVVVGGDFNFPGWDWSGPAAVLKRGCNHPRLHSLFMDTIQELGLDQLVNFNTRQDNTLDLMLTNFPHLVLCVEPLPGISDHEGVLLEFAAKQQRKKQASRQVPLYNSADWVSLRASTSVLVSSILATYTEDSATEDIWTSFKTGILELVKKHVPHKMTRSKLCHPWIDGKLKRLIRKRDRLYKQWKKSGNLETAAKCKKLKHQIQKQLRQAYWRHITNVVADQTTNKRGPTKNFWAYIKSLRTDSVGVSPLMENGKLITDAKEQAELLNRQFQSVFSPATPYSAEDFKSRCQLDPHRETDTIHDIDITEVGVLKLLQSLDPHKASGPDGISPRVLRELATELSPVLTLIFRSSLKNDAVPADWRTAFVTPAFKKGERSCPANYRPISLTSVVCKMMEHIVTSTIMQFCEDQNILCPEQHGFRKGRSCETQLLGLVDEITYDLERGKQTDLVIMDFAKAFDKVSHSLLLHKLNYYGIRGHINAWIQDFLLQRQQAVVVDGAQSSYVPVESGVPQGSVLGPSLFLLYINDLPRQTSSRSRLFADDTICQRTILEPSDQLTLQQDICKLEEWEKTWNMSFHPDKCQILRVSRSRRKFEQPYTIHGHTLEVVENAKYLGVTISSDGTWDNHIRNTISKANKILGLLRRSLKIDSTSVKNQAYLAYVRPLLEYASSTWDPHTAKNISSLEAVQRRAARWVTQDYHQTSSVDAMMDTLGWPTLQSRRTRARLQMFHKIHHGLASVDSSSLPSVAPTRRSSRLNHPFSYLVPHSRTDYRKFSFFPRTIPDWNGLSAAEASAPSLPCLQPPRP